jgi:hypothetical protein
MAEMMVLVDTAVTVPVNIAPLIDDTDFKSREVALTYDQAGMDLVWNFQTAAGVTSQTAVTPTTAGDYDWTHSGDGMYKIEIPASGGASIDNDTEGFGWFTGFCTGVLPWRGPIIQFSPANVVNGLVTGTDKLQVDAVEISSDSGAADNLELDYDGTGYAKANSTIGTCTTNTDLVTAAAVRTEMDSNSTQLAAIVLDTGTTLDNHLTDIKGTAFVKDTHSLIDIKTETALVVADTNELQTDWTNGGRLDLLLDQVITDIAALNNLSTGDIDTQLAAIGLDHLVGAAVVGTDVVDNSIIAQMVSKSATADWDDFVNTTDSLQANRDKLTDIETDSGEIGAAGAGLTNINLPNQTMDIVGDITGNLSGSVGSVTGAVGSVTGAVGSVTGNVGGDVQGNVDGSVASVTGNVGGNVTGTVGELAAQAKADVNAEVSDVLKVDTISELGVGIPATTPTFEDALMLLYMALRNKLDVTSGFKEVHNNAGTVITKKALSDDGTTYSEAKAESG